MSTNAVAINFPYQSIPMVDPTTGRPTEPWWYVQQSLLNRTGGPAGVSSDDVLSVAETALADAGAAQSTANTALATADTAQTTANTAISDANGAQTTANAAATAVAAETARAEAAEASLAPKASPIFSGAPPVFALFPSYANDAAAAVGGIVVGQLYWSSTVTAVAQRRV